MIRFFGFFFVEEREEVAPGGDARDDEGRQRARRRVGHRHPRRVERVRHGGHDAGRERRVDRLIGRFERTREVEETVLFGGDATAPRLDGFRGELERAERE